MWPLVSSSTTPSPSQTTRSIAEMVTQVALDVGSRQRRVAIRVEQALLGGEHRAFAVDVDRSTFEHERRPVADVAGVLEHSRGDRVVLGPRVVEPTPGVEHPVHPAAGRRGRRRRTSARRRASTRRRSASARPRSRPRARRVPRRTGPARLPSRRAHSRRSPRRRRRTPPARACRSRARCRLGAARASSSPRGEPTPAACGSRRRAVSTRVASLQRRAALADELGDEGSPPRLVGGAEALPGVTVEVLEEGDVVAPVGIVIEERVAAVRRTSALSHQEQRDEPARQLGGDARQIGEVCPSRSASRP